jgi:uncharacterized membrane protein YjjP (DUF1212 family)
MLDLDLVDKVETYMEAIENMVKKYAPWIVTFIAGFFTGVIVNMMGRMP